MDRLGGDSFYIRAHFNYSNSIESNSTNSSNNGGIEDLNFKINDILHVTDTLHNGVIGQWVATKLNREKSDSNNDSTFDIKGIVPNQTNAEHLVATAKTIDQLSASNNSLINMFTNGSNNTNGNMSLGASARMSIRKKLAGKGTLAKRSKSASRSNANSDIECNTGNIKVSKTNTFYGSKYPAYERVVLKEANFARPVVIFGALADVARERLKVECPNKFEIPESYSNNGNDDNQSTSGVIKLATIKSIVDTNRHCLLDITPNAVDHLNYAQYFPICIYLKAQSHNQVKELRQKNAKNVKPKSSKRLYENALRLGTFYSHLFTATVSLESNQWFKKIKEIIDLQQEQPLWISQDIEHLLASNNNNNNNNSSANLNVKNTNVNNNFQYNNNNYDRNLLHQKFIAKQNQLMKQQQYLLDDNFEFPIYTASNTIGPSGGMGASSTYSLYEDNNYRSSIAASDSDLNAGIGLINTTDNSSPLFLKNECSHNTSQPIYSTNFHNNRNLNNNNMTMSNGQLIVAKNLEEQQNLLTRVHSDPNIAAINGINCNQINLNQYQTQTNQQYASNHQNENRTIPNNTDSVIVQIFLINL